MLKRKAEKLYNLTQFSREISKFDGQVQNFDLTVGRSA
jgi:hypothetical protein